MASNCSSKWPPKFENESGYENWKKDISIWGELTDLPESKRALAIHLSLTGRARIASSEISVDDLKKDDGVDTLLAKLDSLFLPEKGRRQFTAFHNLYNLRRSENLNIAEFVSEFEHMYFKFQSEDMKLPDVVMAFMLLSSCKLTESDVQLVMTGITDVTYSNMKSVLKRIFSSSINAGGQSLQAPDVALKVEQVFHNSESSETTLFTRNNRRGRGRNYARTDKPNHGRGANFERLGNGRKLNPVGHNGEVSRCVVCDSRLHWARNCPHAYENANKKIDDKDETVNLSLFMGFTNKTTKETKLNLLMQESQDCAVMDTGCSTTVCGEAWLEKYSSSLSDYERSLITEENSIATFTFGDGMTFSSLKRVSLPCWIGNQRANIAVDVVECNIPLLMSCKSMKKANLIWNFKRDTIQIGVDTINLKRATSGHYLLPLNI